MEPERRNPRLGSEQSRALKGRKERCGKPGQPQLTPWAAGIFRGLHYTTAGNIQLMLARGVRPGWSHPGPFPSELGLRRPSRAWGRAENRPCQRPIPLPPLPETQSHELEISNLADINEIALPWPSTLPVRCYSGPVRAPAFRERQTGAPRPGCKSSPWPLSVSRSTDRVTQDNGIDPKPFWRLRAIPKEPHLTKPYPGRPSRPVVEARFGKKKR